MRSWWGSARKPERHGTHLVTCEAPNSLYMMQAELLLSLILAPFLFVCFPPVFPALLSSLNAHDHTHSRRMQPLSSFPTLCCLSVFLSHLSSLKQRNRFQFHVFSLHSSLCLFLHPPVSILISGNQLAVNNLLNSIDRHHLVSWPAT